MQLSAQSGEYIPECSECHCPLKDLLMPGECTEEVPPLNILPSCGGTAGLHFAVSVTVLESEIKTKEHLSSM